MQPPNVSRFSESAISRSPQIIKKQDRTPTQITNSNKVEFEKRVIYATSSPMTGNTNPTNIYESQVYQPSEKLTKESSVRKSSDRIIIVRKSTHAINSPFQKPTTFKRIVSTCQFENVQMSYDYSSLRKSTAEMMLQQEIQQKPSEVHTKSHFQDAGIDSKIEQTDTVDVILSVNELDEQIQKFDIRQKFIEANLETSALQYPKSSSKELFPLHAQKQAFSNFIEDSQTINAQYIEFELDGVGIYRGEVINGEMNGYGEILTINRQYLYEGEFLNGKYHGLGILWNDALQENEELKGDMKDFIEALLTSEKVKFEEEDFRDQEKNMKISSSHQINVVTDMNDEVLLEDSQRVWTKYEGLFKSGRREGNGYLYFTDGSVFFGEFENDQVKGLGVLIDSKSLKTFGTWAENKLINKL